MAENSDCGDYCQRYYGWGETSAERLCGENSSERLVLAWWIAEYGA